jgi:hypothetical protein
MCNVDRAPTSARRDKPRVLYAGVGLALGCGVGAAIGLIFGAMAYSIRGVRFTKAVGVKHRHSVKAGVTLSEGGSS